MIARLLIAAWMLYAVTFAGAQSKPFEDHVHPSKVFGENRNYRLFLPPGYEHSTARYPVIYYFHGHSDRYTLEKYDDGKDTVPKIAKFVAANDVIVVTVDGYVARDYTGFYGGSPWDVRADGGISTSVNTSTNSWLTWIPRTARSRTAVIAPPPALAWGAS